MLKNRLCLAGMLALAFGLFLAGCDLLNPSSPDPDPKPTVTSVKVSPGMVAITRGGKQQFSAVVTGSGTGYDEVNWSVDSTLSTIDSSGLLTVHENETNGLLVVTASSVADDTKSSTAAVAASDLDEASLKEVVGQLSETFIFGKQLPRYQETAIGNMITDANVWYFNTFLNKNSDEKIDFAFHNGGCIREELSKGPVTRGQIVMVLPFENYLCVASLTGEEIRELFEYIGALPQGDGGFPQFSKEVRYTLDVPNKKVEDLTIGGVPVNENKTYRFCTNDYLLGGGDGYTVLKEKAKDRDNPDLLLPDVVIKYIKANDDLKPALDGRMVVTDGVNP